SPRLTPLGEAEADTVFDTVNGAMINARNRAWIPVILDTLDSTDGTVIAAFGAAHLSGEEGVLNLLAEEGFELERAPF
ncbi:TraB/GumN family protein, partial [Pararhodobacter marinus]|uniref:TraB/GumN family protein n=2 Tax=Rhodobacterales TaxID=204455 RepID=UPI003512ED50